MGAQGELARQSTQQVSLVQPCSAGDIARHCMAMGSLVQQDKACRHCTEHTEGGWWGN